MKNRTELIEDLKEYVAKLKDKGFASSPEAIKQGIDLYEQCPNPNRNWLRALREGRLTEKLVHPRYTEFNRIIKTLEYEQKRLVRLGLVAATPQPPVTKATGRRQEVTEETMPQPRSNGVADHRPEEADLPPKAQAAYPPELLEKINQLGSLQNQIALEHKKLDALGSEDTEELREQRKAIAQTIKKLGDQMSLIAREKECFDKGEPFHIEPPKAADLAALNKKIRNLDGNITKAKNAILELEESLKRMEKLTGEKDQKERAKLLKKLSDKQQKLSNWIAERDSLKLERDAQKAATS